MKFGTAAARLSLACAVSLLAVASANAQDFPSRPVTLIVPFGAGGPTDAAARVLAQSMGENLGQPVIVENRPGAASMIGAEYVANAPGDGYTLLIGTTSAFGTNPHVFRNITYDAREFAPVGLVVTVPLAFAVRGDMPADTIEEFVAFAAAQPDLLNYSSAGLGAHSSLACYLAQSEIGVEMVEIPYQGTGPALADLIAGNVDALCDAVGTLSGPYGSGQVKLIGMMDAERSTAIPDVPTFVESGFPDLVINNWFAVVAPGGTPDAVVATLSTAIESAVADPNVQETFLRVGFVPNYMPPAELSEFMAAEWERWRQVVEETGVSLD